MRAKPIFPLLLLLGTLLCLPAHASSAATYSPQLELGYSPGTLTSTSSGVPVYTIGDSMWAATGSQDPYTYQLYMPNGDMVAQGVIEPRTVILLHMFASGDDPGTWTLEVDVEGSVAGTQAIPILFVQDTPVSFNMTGDSISSSGIFSMNFTAVNAPSAQDFSSCVFGSSPPGTVSVPIPISLGKGNILVTMNGTDSIAIAPQPVVGQVTSPFDFWVELYQNYSYTEGGVSTMVFRDVQAAASTAVPLSSGVSSTNAPFTPAVALRPGLFSLRIFFDSSNGLFTDEAPVLVTEGGDSWISLQGCEATSQPASNVITVKSTLTDDPSLWPSEAFLMYQEDGVEGYSAAPLSAEVSAVDVTAAPWGATFNDSELSVVPGPGIQSSASVDGTFFFAASHYPVEVGVSLLTGEYPVQVTIPVPYSLMTIPINSSNLVVTATVGKQGADAPGTNLLVSADGTVIAKGATNSAGKATFFLPVGNYSVTGDYKNVTEDAVALTTSGQVSAITLTFPGPPSIYGTFLLASAAIGIVATLFIWTNVYRGRRDATTPAGPKSKEPIDKK